MVVLNEDRPIFVDLANQIADDILAERYPEDGQVPSTNELSAFYRINPATAGKALNRLVDSGILYKRRGLGMFVAPGAVESLHTQRRADLTDHYVKPLLAEAQRLGLTSDQVLDLIRKELS